MASSAPEAKAAAKSKVVFNPYARKKNTASSASVPAPVTANKISSTNRNNTARHLPPPPVDNNSTFSQAFGDPDAHFGEEERAQQVAFEEDLASKSPTIHNNDGATSNSTNGIGPRDHHKMLQPQFLHISTRQRGNPLIPHIRNVPHKFSTIVPDYIFAPTRCALFLSLRYHKLHPNYIHRRVAELKSDFEYRMLLCYVDIDDNTSPLLFLNDLCVQNNLSLILAWSEEEAARYLETVKAFDGRDATMIKKNHLTTHIEQATHALRGARSVNKTDALQLLTQFGSWHRLANASVEELSICPGLGPKKVKRLREVFHRPFSAASKRTKQDKETKDGDGKKGLGSA